MWKSATPGTAGGVADYGEAVSEPQQSLPAVHEAWLPREHRLHRPRHGGRQLTALISAVVFFLTPTLLWVFGVRPGQIENHPLAGFPSLASGWNVFTGLPNWATDQLSFRSGAIQADDAISRGIFGEGAPLDQGDVNNVGPLPAQPPPAPPKNVPVQPGQPPNQAGQARVVEGLDGWLYYGFDAEAKCSASHDLTDTLARIDQIRQAVVSSGRKFVFVIAPDKTTMVPQFLPSTYPDKACSQAAEAPTWARFDQAGILDLRPALRASEQQAGHPIYPSNDTHWGDEGSLVMTRAIANAIQPDVTQTWQSQPLGPYQNNADLPPLINKQATKTNTLYSLRPDGFVDRAGPSEGDIDKPVYRSASPLEGTVDQRTLIYGDSFIGASSRYLSGAFTNLTMLASFTQKTTQAQALDEFVNARAVVLESVERDVAAGQLTFIDDGFISALQTKLAQNPVR
jgi:alginate O-acetyltransferase complex protein AlgJ